MDLQTLVKTTDYVAQFKQHKVIYRRYNDLNLMIVKRKYGSNRVFRRYPVAQYKVDLNLMIVKIIDTSGTNHHVVFFTSL